MSNPKKVMIVDDEPDIVQAIELALKVNGYMAEGFTNPAKAIEEFRNNGQEYALVISDIRMPTMSGLELARNIKEVDPDVPLVFMTAFEINKSEFLALFPSMQVSELVTKPFVNALLIRIVRKYVGITEQH
jgi:DNA-binding NtrC family response regulator